MSIYSLFQRTFSSFFFTYSAGQERTGYVAINLTNPSFLPKTNPNELLPFLCETRNALSSSTAAAAVDAVQPVRGEARAQDEEITRQKDDTREDTAELLNTCTECWKSCERKCYKVYFVGCLFYYYFFFNL